MEHQRRLAGAVGPEQRDALPVLDVQLDAAQRLAPVGIAVPDPARVDRAAHGAAPISRSGTSASATAATKAMSERRSVSGTSCGIVPR